MSPDNFIHFISCCRSFYVLETRMMEAPGTSSIPRNHAQTPPLYLKSKKHLTKLLNWNVYLPIFQICICKYINMTLTEAIFPISDGFFEIRSFTYPTWVFVKILIICLFLSYLSITCSYVNIISKNEYWKQNPKTRAGTRKNTSINRLIKV